MGSSQFWATQRGMTMMDFRTKELTRPKLEEILSSAIEKPLIMIVGPSGYGKSTFVQQYFSKRQEIRYHWFPMHRDEVDATWIWRRICNHVGIYNREFGERIAEVELPSSKQEVQYVLQMIKKYVSEAFYVIIDDYQECNNQMITDMIQAIAEENTLLKIILISRIYPDIPYEEMFLRGHCAVLNQSYLTLGKEETEEIFKINGVRLTEEEITTLYEYTDGWISAVYLALFEYKKQGDFGYFSGINHLMKTAIFDKLTPQMKEFYMKISLFDWFSIEDAAYITEMDFFETALFECKEQFGFLYYDANTKMFQMHTLLRTVAEKELEKSGIDIARLYNRAGEYMEKNKKYVKAIRYYRKSRQWDKIAHLYAGVYGSMIMELAPELFDEVKDDIKEQIWEDSLMALLNNIRYRVMQESADQIRPFFEYVKQKMNNSEKWRTDNTIQGEMMVLQNMLQFNDLEKMNQSFEKACYLLEGKQSSVLGNSLLTYGTICMTILYYKQSGKLLQTIEQEKQYAKYYMQLTKGRKEGWDDLFDAEYALLTADMDTAYGLAQRVCKQSLFNRQTCIFINSYYVILRCLIYRGDVEGLQTAMEEMKEALKDVVHPILLLDGELVEGYISACVGWMEKIPEWLKNFDLEHCTKQMRDIRSGCITYGRILCIQKKWEMLDNIGDQMLVPYTSTIHIYTYTIGYIYKAIAKYYLGEEGQGIHYLKEAIKLAEPDEVRLPFLENSVELSPMIKELQDLDFVKKLNQSMVRYEKGVSAFSAEETKENEPSCPLTKREHELMEYVKQGYRNAQISEKMHIALVTVEKNLTSIYRKLEVSNRTAAIQKMEELKN